MKKKFIMSVIVIIAVLSLLTSNVAALNIDFGERQAKQRTEALVFNENSESQSNRSEGWSYRVSKQFGKTLTLNNVDILVEDGAAIKVPDGVKIIINGKLNKLNAKSIGDRSIGSCYIIGAGDLYIGLTGEVTSDVSYNGLAFAYGNLTVDGVDFKLTQKEICDKMYFALFGSLGDISMKYVRVDASGTLLDNVLYNNLNTGRIDLHTCVFDINELKSNFTFTSTLYCTNSVVKADKINYNCFYVSKDTHLNSTRVNVRYIHDCIIASDNCYLKNAVINVGDVQIPTRVGDRVEIVESFINIDKCYYGIFSFTGPVIFDRSEAFITSTISPALLIYALPDGTDELMIKLYDCEIIIPEGGCIDWLNYKQQALFDADHNLAYTVHIVPVKP